jgi:hypothetical protein
VVADGVSGEGEDKGAGRPKDRLFLAAEFVSKLETRQKKGGGICFVYRLADGAELEAPCTPKGVKELLAQLGVKVTLAETEQLLGVTKGGGEGEVKEKRGRKAKTTDIQDIKAVLWRYKWVVWQGGLWLVTNTKLLRADLDQIHGLLKQNGVDVGKETLRSYYTDIITDIPKDRLEGIVVTPEPTYGRVGSFRGLWFCHRGELYLVTPNARRVFSRGQWPEGVYALDLGMQGVLPDWEGRIEDLLIYWRGITRRFKGNPKVALAMFLPVLFGQGHIGLILRGPAKSGKSTLLRALAFLHLGRKPNTPSGSVNMRDIIAALHRRQIVFFDEVNTFSPELQETLKRMITHDGSLMRALYTDLETVETELTGSAIFCTTNLEKLASDLRTRCFVWDLEPKGGGAQEQEILAFCGALWRRALAGAIKLYQQAAKLKRPPNNLLPEIRFRDWLSWAYRYAVALGVEKEFVSYVAKSKRAAHRGDKYEFLLDAISHPEFDPKKEYLITELFELAAPVSNETKRIQHSLGREAVRADLVALALDAGYNLSIEKKLVSGDKRARYRFIFTPIEVSEDDFLASLLREAGITLHFGDDDDGDLPPPETTPPTFTPIPPDNTEMGKPEVVSELTTQDETTPLTDIAEERAPTSTQSDAGSAASPAPVAVPHSISARPVKTKSKKLPPSSEWVYRAGTISRDCNNEVNEGLFAPPQAVQSVTTSQTSFVALNQNTVQDDNNLNDDEIIEHIEERLKLHAQHQLPLETSLDWLRRFLLQYELEMWELGLKRAYFHIVHREIDLQNAIERLGYNALTSENDPRLRPLQVRPGEG